MNILLIDNYDSFTYNLEHLFGQLDDVNVQVVRNDEPFLDLIAKTKIDGVIISPGPGDPNDKNYFGNNMKLISEYGQKGLPILGVCLGFQGIASFYGAKLKKAKLPMHGKTSKLNILLDDKLLNGLHDNMQVMRYHSLMIDTGYPFPEELIITAQTDDDEISVKENGTEIMAFRHKNLPIYGVQFHPESFATDLGNVLAENFVKIIQDNS